MNGLWPELKPLLDAPAWGLPETAVCASASAVRTTRLEELRHRVRFSGRDCLDHQHGGIQVPAQGSVKEKILEARLPTSDVLCAELPTAYLFGPIYQTQVVIAPRPLSLAPRPHLGCDGRVSSHHLSVVVDEHAKEQRVVDDVVVRHRQSSAFGTKKSRPCPL